MPKKGIEGFYYKDMGDRKNPNYAILHKNTGDKILGWIRKYCIDEEKETVIKN
jgi:hypothetical protein